MVVRPGLVVLQPLRLSPCQSHGITQVTFRKMFNSCWRESPRSLQFYCGCLSACYLIDQYRLLFWKKMLTSNNVLLRILARLCQLKTVALAAKYGIFQLGYCSVRDVKFGIFSTFRNTVLWLIGLQYGLYQFYVVLCTWFLFRPSDFYISYVPSYDVINK